MMDLFCHVLQSPPHVGTLHGFCPRLLPSYHTPPELHAPGGPRRALLTPSKICFSHAIRNA